MLPLTPFRVFRSEDEWEQLQRKVADEVWADEKDVNARMQATSVLGPIPSAPKREFAEFRHLAQTAKPLMKELEKWNIVNLRKSEKKHKLGQKTNRIREAITLEERDPKLGDTNGNINYFDMRDESKIKGPNVLYRKDEEGPLSQKERQRAGLIPNQYGKKTKAPQIPAKLLSEVPATKGVKDTWTAQGLDFYGFTIGSRYNHADSMDDLLFHGYGVLLLRSQPGKVFFIGDGPKYYEEFTLLTTHQPTNITTETPVEGSAPGTAPSQLRFKLPTFSFSRNTSSRSSATPTKPGDTTRIGSCQTNSAPHDKSHQRFLDRIDKVTPTRRSFGVTYHRYKQQQQNEFIYNTPKTVLTKSGRGKGGQLSFSFRPQPLLKRESRKKNLLESPVVAPKRNQQIDQLVSLGHQLATSHDKEHY